MLRRFPLELYLAVTDFAFYAKVFEQPLRLTLTFLLLLAASLSVCMTIILAWQWFPAFQHFFDWAEENIPPLAVTEGQLSAAVDQPYVVKYQNGETWTLVLDTTGTYADPVGLEEPVVLLTRENLYAKAAGQTQTYRWSDLGPFSLRPEDLPLYESFIKIAYFPTAYSILLIYSLLAKALTATILTPLAYSVAIRYGVRLSFQNGFTIALYSLVPAIAIDLAVTMTGVAITYFDLIYLGAAAVYTFFATQKCALAH